MSDTTPGTPGSVMRVKPELTPAVLAGRYARGQSLRHIAAATGIAYGTVHRRLVGAGVTFRPRGGADGRARRDPGAAAGAAGKSGVG